ncbi:hypothetical protein ABT112_34120, partial [Streptomyces sp. NPDC002055]
MVSGSGIGRDVRPRPAAAHRDQVRPDVARRGLRGQRLGAGLRDRLGPGVRGRCRIVAVGTTAVRALESAASPSGVVRPAAGWTD